MEVLEVEVAGLTMRCTMRSVRFAAGPMVSAGVSSTVAFRRKRGVTVRKILGWACLMFSALLVCFIFGCGKDDPTPPPTTGSISGHITSAATGASVPAANVFTDTGSATSDSSGHYTLASVPVGSYRVTAVAFGYNPSSRQVSVRGGENTQCDIPLTSDTNHCPSPPSNISPPHLATGIPKTVTLTWSCSDADRDRLTYDVYFDAVDPPMTLVASALSDTVLTRASLDSTTTYYWKVIASDGHCEPIESSVWHFRTGGSTWHWTDDFGDNVVSWPWTPGVSGSGPAFAERNGRLEITIPSGSTGTWFYAGLLLPTLSGDLDIQVDYVLIDWPSANTISVGIAFEPSSACAIVRYSGPSGQEEIYSGVVGFGQVHAGTSDQSGQLRIVRAGGIVTTYYRAGGSWTALNSGAGCTGDVQLLIGAWRSLSSAYTGGNVKVAFDNVILTAQMPLQ